jgi:membrane fusion protein (multidrug efflux system)
MGTDIEVEEELPETHAHARPTPSAPRRRRLPLVIGAVVVLIVGAWGVQKWLYGRTHEGTDNAQLDGHITVVAPKVQAFVDRVLVDDNKHVKVGDTLVVLDDRDLKARLSQAEADLATAQAAAGSGGERVGQASAQLASTRAQAASARAAVASAEAAFQKAQADLNRIRGLAKDRIVAPQQLDAAQAAYSAAAANLEAARRQAAAAGSQVSASGAALAGANARVQAAEAALETARLQLSYAYILAPTNGVVAKRSVEPGALVQVGQNLMSIVPDSGEWVTANFKETQLKDMSVGDSATFTVDAYPGRTFHGHVESLSPATGARFALLPPDNATGNFTKVVQRVPVRIAIDDRPNPGHPFRPGMSVDVDVHTR